RLRNRHLVRASEDEAWFRAKELYENANATPRYLGQKQLTRRAELHCHFVLYKGKPKGRSKTTCNGERARSKHSEQCAQREREPWLLVTSLPATSKLAKKVVSIYSTRMQIEESFRDVKSVRFGIGFELNLSRSAERLQILLLVAMIATFVLWLLGMAARNSQQHLQYQANTVKNRQVLSAIYLGLRVATDRRFEFNLSELKVVALLLQETVRQHGEGW
ncbi:MAG: IS4 family transposase, partial [Gammaproteobacteria bacterium]|nr:IS4 family transposase [Gammaproteobacteria bacterium]MCW8959008.1 IS4 family transposase [Gammaproteobacteria bacterium]